MSKKSSNFAPDMKKAYQIPTIEIITLTTQWIMELPESHVPVSSAPAHHVGGGGGTSQPF